MYIEFDKVPAKAGAFFTLSVYSRSDLTESPTDHLFVNFYDDTVQFTKRLSRTIPVNTPFWTKVTLSDVVPPNTVAMSVGIVKSSKQGSVWADDFSLRVDDVQLMTNGSFEQK
jgi:hypothetical protein